ncbi:hypothetical protein BK140_05315 [Paenibacillus macerans]|nr:hypothetical protein BK140_05315 [Paenibacillus macerans]
MGKIFNVWMQLQEMRLKHANPLFRRNLVVRFAITVRAGASDVNMNVNVNGPQYLRLATVRLTD